MNSSLVGTGVREEHEVSIIDDVGGGEEENSVKWVHGSVVGGRQGMGGGQAEKEKVSSEDGDGAWAEELERCDSEHGRISQERGKAVEGRV